MTVNVNRYKCGYCGACVGVCPVGALELVETWIEVDNTCTVRQVQSPQKPPHRAGLMSCLLKRGRR
ncbi:MAG: 4Fe-4S binding protein [Candidatus Methanoperedens sp.]|nr:4Fe-4S binding protein [Candidatus Methanoperedens sp.]